MVTENLNAFQIAQKQFDTAADFLKLDPGMCKILRSCKRQLVVSIPTRLDNGSLTVFEGYRVQRSPYPDALSWACTDLGRFHAQGPRSIQTPLNVFDRQYFTAWASEALAVGKLVPSCKTSGSVSPIR